MWGLRTIIPPTLQEQILSELHKAHPRVARMKAAAHSHVWWPGIDSDIEERARGCKQCFKTRKAPQVAPLFPWSWPTAPWQRIHVQYSPKIIHAQEVAQEVLAPPDHASGEKKLNCALSARSSKRKKFKILSARSRKKLQVRTANPKYSQEVYSSWLNQQKIDLEPRLRQTRTAKDNFNFAPFSLNS